MESVNVLLLPDRIVVNPLSRVQAGYWISHGPWTQLATDAGADAIADAVNAALSASRSGIRPPDDPKALTKERLSAAGVRSERAYLAGSCLVSVLREGQRHVITLHANGGVSGEQKGFTELAPHQHEVPADAAPGALGAAVLAAFGQCTS